MTFIMKLGRHGDDEIIICCIKGEKKAKNNQNLHRKSFGKSSQSDIKQGSLEICSGFRPHQQLLITLGSTQRANISNVQMMPFVQQEVLKTREQTSFCDLLSVYLVSEAQACYSALFISRGTSARLSFEDHALKMQAN